MELATISDVKLEEFKDSRFVVPERVTFKQVNEVSHLFQIYSTDATK